MTNYAEAQAHYRQLLALGADEDQAQRDTQTAFELNTEEADMLIDPMAYYERAAELDAVHYGCS